MPGSPKHEFHVPGAYHFDNPPFFTTRALGADVFLPPVALSPADSTSFDLTRSAGSLYSEISTSAGVHKNGRHDHGATAKRKRATQDSRESTPLAEWATDVNGTNGETPRGLQQKGIAYTLAGQIDIAGAPPTNSMDESVYSDVGYRRALGPHATTTPHRGGYVGNAGEAEDPQADTERWNVLHALGNVVGKVWEFCTTGAFRGFHAGGGAGYDWQTGKPMEVAGDTHTENTEQSSFFAEPTSTTFADRSDTPSRATDRDTPQQRNGKRRQVSLAGDELGRNWVIVDPKQKQYAQKHPPLRGGRVSSSAAAALVATNARTPDRRATSYVRGGTTTATPGTAASRRINTPISRLGGGPGATPSTTQHNRRGAARVSHAGSPSLSSREPASFASPRSSTPVGAAASPRRPFASSGTNGTHSPGGGSRIPVPLSGADANYNSNPFARAAAASPRPGSRAGGVGGQSSSIAFGAGGQGLTTPAGHGHRRSYSGRAAISPLPKQKSALLQHDASIEGVAAIGESPRLNDEAKRLAAQNLAAEKESDAKMEAFNLRLKEMIRQGQEALGTTFEVNGDDDDSGQEDYWADD